MINHLSLVAIVGPPNAGKSTLLNKIAGKALGVTSDIAGTTRDRQYADTVWNGVTFTLVDTAGLSLADASMKKPQKELELSLQKQIDVALTQADSVLFVVDGKQPVAAVEQSIIKKFRNINKPLILAINKLDSPKLHQEKLAEFSRLGIKAVFPISSISGLGLGDLLDAIVNTLPASLEVKEEENSIAVSIIGKPNVGKSSIFNKILKQERVVVSPIPGTTRTAIDEHIKIGEDDFTFIDTAGLKKKEYRQAQPDIFGGFQTFKAIRRSDVCFFVLDVSEEITKQDQVIAGEIMSLEKGCIILANKIDLVKDESTLGKNLKTNGKDDKYKTVRDYISHHFPFLWSSPLFFVSAETEEGLSEAIAAIKPIFENRNKMLEADKLSEFLKKAMKKNPPKLLRDQKTPKVFSLKQIDSNPPKFELFVNYPAAISNQFRKFLENSIIKELDFWGTPITLKLRGKDKS